MPKPNSTELLVRFAYGEQHLRHYDLSLASPYRQLLARLGNPQDHLPPVVHVAGTNGKGSTCAFTRAIAEAAGYRVHVFTSPHLVRFHERIRISGKLISEDELCRLLQRVTENCNTTEISYFEAATAVAFLAFAEHPADLVVLETGLGGRLDATNVITAPAATIITRLSYDHQKFLGDSIEQIAGEKAGIMRRGLPCFTINQPEAGALSTLQQAADKMGAPLHVAGKNWQISFAESRISNPESTFFFSDDTRQLYLPPPALLGAHQYENAALAIAALGAVPLKIPATAYAAGMRNVTWPARLQNLTGGKLANLLPPDWELWLDGGHNDSGGEILAQQAAAWQQQDDKPLLVICGMINTKKPDEFLRPLMPYAENFTAIKISSKSISITPEILAAIATECGAKNGQIAPDIFAALKLCAATMQQKSRVLICGSLYLAGEILAANES